ncbi:hypothetical protein Bca101_093381 [Brassica carinata]
MKFREWDLGTGGAKGISDHHYGCLEANRKGFKGSDTTDTIEIRRDLGNNGKLGIVGFREEICGINQIIWHLIGLDWWRGVEEIRLVYIKRIDTEVYIILSISSSINSLFHLEVFGVSGLLVVMSQSQLLGKSGELKNAEGTRKRLKISVPHFDNTELIKQYDKTIIGRCMNPEAQDVKALIVMLPKIWKVEDRVGGTDLGLGKILRQFSSLSLSILTIGCVDYCPLTVNSPQKKKEHGKGREYREYLGKGKGKMYEEHETKWVKIPEKGSARYRSNRTSYRGDEDGSRFRSSRSDRSRGYTAEERTRPHRGAQRGSSPRAGVGEEAREEGEIPQKGQGSTSRTVLETSLPLPQQDSSAIILAEVNKVPLIPESGENGLDVVNDLLGEDIVDGEDDGMELDEESVNVVGNEEDSDDGFNNLTDGDVAVEGNNDKIPEESHELDEEAIQPEVAEGKEQIPGEADKKKVVRKSLFKSSAIAGGSTKARMVQALVATRKRTVSKTAPRHGEGAKQQEEKGPSNPKPNVTKV